MSVPQSLTDVLLSAAHTYVDQEDWEAARRCLDELRAVQPAMSPDDPDCRRAWRIEGEIARGRGDHDVAEAVWLRCHEAQCSAGDESGAAESLWLLGDLMLHAGRMSDATERLIACLDMSSDPSLRTIRARALESLGSVHRLRGNFRDAIESFTESLAIRSDLGDREGVARNHSGLGNSYHRMGKFDLAIDHHRRSLAECEAVRDDRGIAKSLNNIGTVRLQRGEYQAARDHFERAHELATAIGDTRVLSNVVSNLGLISSYEGDAADAESYYLESLRLREQNHDRPGQAISLNNLAQIALAAGRNQDALDFATRSIDLREQAGLKENVFRAWFNRAQAHLELNQLEAADHAARQILDSADAGSSAEARVQTELVLAAIALAREDATAAERHAEQAAQEANANQLRRGYGEALSLRGHAHLLAGDLDKARSLLIECESVFRELHSPFHLANCQLSLGQLFLRVGAPEASAARLRQAADTFMSLGNDLRRWTCLMLLAEAEWPLSHRQARVTLADVIDLARNMGRDDLLHRANVLLDELTARVPAAGTGKADAGPLLALARAVHECEDSTVLLDTALRSLADQLDLECILAERPPPGVGRVGPFPAQSIVSDSCEELLVDARRRRQPRFRWGKRRSDQRARFELAMPISGLHGSPAGTLFVTGWEHVAGDYEHRPPQSLSLLEAATFLIGLASESIGHAVVSDLDVALMDEDALSRHGMVGKSTAIRRVFRTIERVAVSDASVLIQGESGTGKELVARAIHDGSARSEKPFVAISCPSIPRELIEAELFGHEKGAFTGAHVARPGQVEIADGGTLFLDEIGDMDLATQSKMLRFLQEREFQHVGGRQTLRVDVRLLAATSRDLDSEVRDGRFREDLYYRVNVVPLRLPPLQTRIEDVPHLAAHFLAEFAGDAPPKRLSKEALDAFSGYRWPGNVREVRNLIEFLVAMVPGDIIGLQDLPSKLRSSDAASQPLHVSADDEPLRSGETLDARLMTVEGSLIRWALDSSDWNQSKAAKLLGITETKIRNRMKRYGVERPAKSGA